MISNELQAIITGAIIGGLHKTQDAFLSIDVEPQYDAEGEYLPEIIVTGRATGTKLRVRVEVVEE